MRRILQLVLALGMAFFVSSVLAQGTTTSAITGQVVDSQREPLPGATVLAVHEPSGTTYGAVTALNGGFNIPNMRVGGPYTVTVNFVGYNESKYSDINLRLGSATSLNVTLSEGTTELGEVIIAAARSDIFSSDRTGASTNLSNETIGDLPTINRNISDFTRLTPQSNGGSFAGRDERFNNYTIDGNIYNNNFGLGSGQFAGSNPISLDAIEEIQVNLAPFDVRQGGFTGASVNAITRSGTNEFSASGYFYTRNEKLTGSKIGGTELNVADAFNRIVGARVGGPILKDKLFFFVSLEQERASNPGLQKVASRPGLTPDGQTVSRVPADQLEFVSEQLASLYGYETGPYEGYDFASEGLRINARLDFNINQSNKFMLRFNRYDAFRDVGVNGNSLRYNPSALRYFNTNRFGIEAMNFRNSHYSVDNNVTSVVGELNSTLGSNISNNLNIGYTNVADPIRGIPGEQDFPFIEVMEPDDQGNLLYYMTMGNELFSVGNLLENKILNVTDNLTIFRGKHTYTAGLNFEYMTFKNAFNPVVNGLYRYNSYDDFVASVIDGDNSIEPALFLQGYSYEGIDDIPTDDTAFGQAGLYVQDEIQLSRNLKFTGGLRVDFQYYPIDLPANPNLDALNLEFVNPQNDEVITPDVSKLPPVRPLWSPRVGINWDVKGDGSTQLRGGTGIFSGRIPFVWISNQVNGNGVTRGGYGLTPGQWGTPDNPTWDGFQPDVAYYRPNPETLDAQVSNSLAITDEDFRFPQVWRTNLAVDKRLGDGWIVTLEGMLNKDINSPLAVNINTNDPSTRIATPYEYPYWTSGSYYTNSSFRDVILLTNTNKGYYASMTGQVRKDFGNGLNGSLAYTRSVSKDYGLEGGSQASSLWPFAVVDSRNDPEIGYSRFDIPNRVVGFLTYTTEAIVPKFPTTFTLFYEGGDRGRYSYTFSGNFGDGAARLMYIPEDQSDANLIDIVDSETGLTVADADEQWDVLNAFIEQDKYLSKHRGEVAERNGAKLPWLNRFDLRIIQDISIVSKHKFQLTFDVLNFGNLLSSEWGIGKTPVQTNLMAFRGIDGNNNAQFSLNTIPGTSEFPSESFRDIIAISQTWSAQFGVRYIFN